MNLLIQCRDRVGLVSAISDVLARERWNIISLREHVDKAGSRFFLRIEAEPDGGGPMAAGESRGGGGSGGRDTGLLGEKIRQVLPEDALVSIDPPPEKKLIVLVTKEYHCLADILVRHYFKTLGASVQCVIGNHPDLQELCGRFSIPFYQVPLPVPADIRGQVQAGEPARIEREILEIIGRHAPDYIILAKFMRILSPSFVAQFPGRIMNIHHSFLPAFAGARPYRQAFERGVKLIGATAHFVTDMLDEGPIIAQQIIPVDHSHSVMDMVRAGKEIETAVLARALRLVVEDRVFVYGNKTVVFEF